MPKKNKILIIEDEEFLADVLETKLKNEGYEVLAAGDGREGFTKIESWKPDLILLDIVMPKLNGYEVLEKMYDDHIKIPVIIISNSGQPVELEKIKKLGAVDYLIKTEFEPQEVADKVGKYLKIQSELNNNFKDSKMDNKKKLLLVEDDQLLREICAKQLLKAGFNVSTVIDGGEALEKVRQEHPDLILLDIMLPTVDGFEILKQIKNDKDPKIANIPVLMLSNLGQETDMAKAKGLGASGYLIKAHFTTDEIVSEVKKVLKENGAV